MTISSFVFRNAVGRAVEWHYQAKHNGSPLGGLVLVVVDRSTDTNEDMQDATTLAGLLGGATNEVTNTNYSRHQLTATGVGQLLLPDISTYDTVNEWRPLDLPDQAYSAIGAGTAWTDTIVCYLPDTSLAADDTQYRPISCNRSPATPDGNTILVTIIDYLHAKRS